MCLQLYPAHASCKHEDGNGTPRPYTFWKCDQMEAGQECQVEYRPWFSANRGAQALCSRCGKAMKELKNSIGIDEDWDRSSSCQLFRVIGWKKNTYQYVWLSTAVVAMVDKQMNSVWWKGRDHKFQERIINLTSFFNSFKSWLLYKMDKVKDKEVLPFTVKWMMETLAKDRRVDDPMPPETMIAVFERTFIPWIEEWPQDFGTENNSRDKNWTPFRTRIEDNWKKALNSLL